MVNANKILGVSAMAVSLLSKALAKVLSTGSGMAVIIGVGCSLVLGTGNFEVCSCFVRNFMARAILL